MKKDKVSKLCPFFRLYKYSDTNLPSSDIPLHLAHLLRILARFLNATYHIVLYAR